MRNVGCFLMLVSILLISSCGFTNVEGSGTVITEQRPVSGFTAVSLSGTGKLIINQTGKEGLTITADDNLMQYLTSEVHGSQLILGTTQYTNLNPSAPVVYKLDVGKLVEIEVSGSGEVDAPGLVTTGLKVNANGATKMNISGQADQQEITISGAGEYHAAGLKSKEVTITITGSGDAELAVSDKLNVTVTGAGSVEYIGDPV